MALTKAKKQEVVSEVGVLLAASKLTVIAKYQGTSVKAMQSLRASAKAQDTVIKVVKNRLIKQALSSNDVFKNADTSALTGQLLYVFNQHDEVAPAQVLATFAKTNPNIKFVGAYSVDGSFMSAEDVTTLANLPSKDQLRAQLVGTVAAPLTGFINVMNGNVRGVLNVLTARAESL